jgi:hypothetical protein
MRAPETAWTLSVLAVANAENAASLREIADMLSDADAAEFCRNLADAIEPPEEITP